MFSKETLRGRDTTSAPLLESVSEKAKGERQGGRGSETQFGQEPVRVSNPARRPLALSLRWRFIRRCLGFGTSLKDDSLVLVAVVQG